MHLVRSGLLLSHCVWMNLRQTHPNSQPQGDEKRVQRQARHVAPPRTARHEARTDGIGTSEGSRRRGPDDRPLGTSSLDGPVGIIPAEVTHTLAQRAQTQATSSRNELCSEFTVARRS